MKKLASLLIFLPLFSYGQGHFPIGGSLDTIDMSNMMQKGTGRAYYQNGQTSFNLNDFASQKTVYDSIRTLIRLFPLIFGDSTTLANISSDPAWIFTHTVDPSLNTNNHGLSVATNFTKNVNGLSYAEFDSRGNTGGTVNYNHVAPFQNAFTHNTTGQTTFAYGFVDVPTVNNGTLLTRNGVSIKDVQGTGSVINNNGIQVDDLTDGQFNYSIKTGVGNVWFGDTLEMRNPSGVVGSGAATSYFSGSNIKMFTIGHDITSTSRGNMHFIARVTNAAGDAGLSEVFTINGGSAATKGAVVTGTFNVSVQANATGDFVTRNSSTGLYGIRTAAQSRADIGADNATNLTSGTVSMARLDTSSAVSVATAYDLTLKQNKLPEITDTAIVSTTNATPTTIFTLPLPTSGQYLTVTADTRAKSTNDYYRGVKTILMRNISGTVSALGTIADITTPMSDAALSTATFTVTPSGTNVLVQVTGVAATNIDWKTIIRYKYN